uniref:Uncharacterized protein n=1 Tax=Oryza punctata TaxID=4537 RepID=A0A0E0MKM4_ORYPU
MASAVLVFAGMSVAIPAISFFVNKAFSYLNKYHKAEGLGDMKKRLKKNIPNIQSIIDVVDPDYIKERSEDLDTWLWQLRDAVEEAEDAIDELEYYELKEKQKDLKVSHLGSSFAKMKHKFVQSVKLVKVLGKTSDSPLKRLKKAMEDLDEAAKGVENFLTVVDLIRRPNLNNPQWHHSISRYSETGRMLTADRVFGRENEKERIVGWLISTSSEENEVVMNNNPVPIMSIVGHDPQKFEELQEAGEKIVKKLRECPLVTKVVAGHLPEDMTVQFWKKFLDEHLGYFDGGMENIMKVLKVCFRYCSIFPQDHEFKKEELVQMWIASGLISQTTADVIKDFSQFKNLRTIIFEDCHDIQDNTVEIRKISLKFTSPYESIGAQGEIETRVGHSDPPMEFVPVSTINTDDD